MKTERRTKETEGQALERCLVIFQKRKMNTVNGNIQQNDKIQLNVVKKITSHACMLRLYITKIYERVV